METDLIYRLTGRSEAKTLVCVAARCNGHFQAGPGTAPAPGPRANGEHRGPGWSGEGNVRADLFSEMNQPEMQKLKQQLVAVSVPLFPGGVSHLLRP